MDSQKATISTLRKREVSLKAQHHLHQSRTHGITMTFLQMGTAISQVQLEIMTLNKRYSSEIQAKGNPRE